MEHANFHYLEAVLPFREPLRVTIGSNEYTIYSPFTQGVAVALEQWCRRQVLLNVEAIKPSDDEPYNAFLQQAYQEALDQACQAVREGDYGAMSLGWLRMISRGDGFFAAIYYGIRHRDKTITMEQVRDLFFRDAAIREELYEKWSEHNFPKQEQRDARPPSSQQTNDSNNSEQNQTDNPGESVGIESLLDSLRNAQQQLRSLQTSTSVGSSTT